jgi:hypothetical protein
MNDPEHQLVCFNERVIGIKKEYESHKQANLERVITHPQPLQTRSFIGWSEENANLHVKMMECVNKIALLFTVSSELRSRYTDVFFPNLGFLLTDMNVCIEAMEGMASASDLVFDGRAATLIRHGLSLPLMKMMIDRVMFIHRDMISFTLMYILSIPHGLSVHLLKKPTCRFLSLDGISSFYKWMYDQPNAFELVRHYGRHILPFYFPDIPQSQMLTQSANQKTIEKRIDLQGMIGIAGFIFSLFDCKKKITLEGCFYDYLIYDFTSDHVFVLFEVIASLIGMKVDNTIRRIYTLSVDYNKMSVAMSSKIAHYDSIPELTVEKIDLVFLVYIQTKDSTVIKRVSIGQFLGKERCFEFRNHRHGNMYCMVLNKDRFVYTDTNNKIPLDTPCKIIGTAIHPSVPSKQLGKNAPMLTFTDESNVAYAFFPSFRCATKGHFVMDTQKNPNVVLNGPLMTDFIGCETFQTVQKSDERVVFEGTIVDNLKRSHGSAKLMIGYGTFISNTKKLNLEINSVMIQMTGML